MRAFIVGEDWKRCYLTDGGSEERKMQVLVDLNKYVTHNTIQVGDLITIDLADHSTGFEQFEIKGIFPRSEIVRLVYIGGGS
ncbi:MAG: hypothetical protein PF518_04720 [Spirochaetaceae bacterium]|jgi:hypothetical protein|nr:hypothetical protein [Spirochaetaceae bacterium]